MEPPNNPTVIPTVANEGGKHWTVPEVRALIGIWSDQGIQQQLEGTMRNKRIFEQIAAELQKLGIERDWKQCRTKYKNLKHEYKIVRTARDLGMAKSMKFFTELDAILGHKKTENSQQESQDEEQATGCAHVKMDEDQTEEDTASNASDEVGGPTAPHGIPGSELFENHTKNPRTLSIKRKALEDEPASVSLKKTASETAANQFPQRTTEPKDSSEYFCSQETPYVTQLHQVNVINL
uniref:Myb/SANT-like DNA-binding domain-containing protein n=1 Tax=Moschus moschiferus TaxID=68415 RepID=A0A8C6G2X7_MOSMO